MIETGRECGTSASSAPSVTTICTPSASARSTTVLAERAPAVARARGRRAGSGRAARAGRAPRRPRTRASRSSRVTPVDEPHRRPRGLEVDELLGVDRREARRRRARAPRNVSADGGGLAGVVPALEGADQRRGPEAVGTALPAQRLHPIHGSESPSGAAAIIGRDARRRAHDRDPARRRRGRRRLRLHAQGPADRAHRHAVPGARAARPHRRDPGARVPRRRPARRPLRPRRPRARARARRALPRRAAGRGARRSSAPRRPTRRRSCRSPTATSTSSTASSSTSRARSTTPRYRGAARARCSATTRCAPSGAARRARAPATTPTSAGCSSTPSRSATLALEACQLHPRLNSDLLICAALVHDLGKTREFTYGAEIGLSEEGRLLGHVVLGQRLLERARGGHGRRRGGSRSRTACSATTGPTRRPAGASARRRRSRCTGSTRSTRASRARSSTACPDGDEPVAVVQDLAAAELLGQRAPAEAALVDLVARCRR